MSEISKLAAAVVRANADMRAVPADASEETEGAAVDVGVAAAGQLAAEPALTREDMRAKAHALLSCGESFGGSFGPLVLSLIRDVAA